MFSAFEQKLSVKINSYAFHSVYPCHPTCQMKLVFNGNNNYAH